MQGKNVLVLLNSTDLSQSPIPQYDLSGERLCVALTIKRAGQKLEFFCHLKPATAERTMAILRERNGYSVASPDKDGGTDHEPGSIDAIARFFDDHRIAVAYQGTELSPEQFDRLDRINNLRLHTVLQGLLTVGTPKAAERAAPTLDELLEDLPSVEQRMLLADDNNVEQELCLVHHFELPTAQQATTYQRSQKFRTLDGGARKVVVNYKELGKLYDAMIHHVDGVIGDRADVVRTLPFQWKINAIEQLFQEAQRKNV
jgi:hypothetical protein